MNKRPGRNDSEDDILRMEREFLAQKAKGSNFKPAATVVKVPKKSLYAQQRDSQSKIAPEKTPTEQMPPCDILNLSDTAKEILTEIQEKIVGDTKSDTFAKSVQLTNVVMGDIIEKEFSEAKKAKMDNDDKAPFPKIPLEPLKLKTNIKSGISLFAQYNKTKKEAQPIVVEKEETMAIDAQNEETKNSLLDRFGPSSVIIQDETAANEIHQQNINMLSSMKEEEILAERKRLLDSIDPTLVELLRRKRLTTSNVSKMDVDTHKPQIESTANSLEEVKKELSESNAAVALVEQSSKENWIHFNVVEKDKLAWMEEIPNEMKNLKPGDKFEARFDWKGVLLPFNPDSISKEVKDDRELYLHGDEPNRPGYTLQELFRLARSTVIQQRISAFAAIAGILNIYNQGFYDQVLDLPISKIFFLLRFGFDENNLTMLEVVSKALGYLFYNETDETLLDFISDNPGCHWQPTLDRLTSNLDNDDPTSIENLKKQLEQLQVSTNKTKSFQADVNETEEESRTSMSDFELAENNLIQCLVRTNILQRIHYILHTIRPDNSTVVSCLKVLIRLARTDHEMAMKIVSEEKLMNCLIENFVVGLHIVDTSLKEPPFYKYPQHLCLKLFRILASHGIDVAMQLCNYNFMETLKTYLFNRDDLKNKLIKVQIESLRLLKCFFIYNIFTMLYKDFLPAFRYMLEWHYNHVIFKEGGPYLLRQHAAALLATVASVPGYGAFEVNSLLGETLRDCCCKWFNEANRHGLKEFSQMTLLSACLNVVAWFVRHEEDMIFESFYTKYLADFINSKQFIDLLPKLSSSSIIARSSVDRRNVHPPLPNVGSIIINRNGPQLVIPQNYSFFFLFAFWNLLEMQPHRGYTALLGAISRPDTLDHLSRFLQTLRSSCNTLLAANYFARIELLYISKLLNITGFEEYFTKPQIFEIAFNFVCCLTSENIKEIELLFQKYLFSPKYINVEESVLNKWRTSFLELVYPHAVVPPMHGAVLSIPCTQMPILPRDWPYYQFRIILQNFIENVQQKPAVIFSERDVLQMTLHFVALIEESASIEIASPTEQLMYLMIAFMGPDSQFLDKDMHSLLKSHISRFFVKYKDHKFDLEQVHEGKCRFENLYALFVDHFQAASYGDELFSALVLLPTAQKYDQKWRSRLWSDYGGALRALNCDETLLIGGFEAYLEPFEKDESILRSYDYAIKNCLVRQGSVAYKIAKYHLEKYEEYFKEQQEVKRLEQSNKMDCDTADQ